MQNQPNVIFRKLFLKIWHFEKFLIQNLTHCIFFTFKIWQVVKLFYLKIRHFFSFLFRNLLFKSSSEILVEILSRCYQNKRTTCWKTITASVESFSTSVWHVLFSHLLLFFCSLRFLMAIVFSMGVMTISSALLIDLHNFLWKMVNLQRFFLKDTKLLLKLPWPSKKQSTIFISFNSNLVFLSCWILSAKTDFLLCVDLVFWTELNKYFLYFFLKSHLFAMLGILSTPLCWWLKLAVLCTLSKSLPLLTTILPLNPFLKSVSGQCLCW